MIWYWKYSVDATRRIWAIVSRQPAIGLTALAREAGMSRASARAALQQLRDAGYITWLPNRRGARTVHVPLIVTGDRHE